MGQGIKRNNKLRALLCECSSKEVEAIQLVLCMFCVHLRDEVPPIPRKCKAFPAGIPKEIWPEMGKEAFDHRKPFKGDGDIQFKAHKGKESFIRETFGSVK